MRSSAAVALLALVGTGPACVPECIGLACEEPRPRPPAADDDDDSTTADDDAAGDDDDDTPVPIVSERSCAVRLRIDNRWSASTLSVAGEWSSWQPQAATADGGEFVLDVGVLAPGHYAWKALPNGDWEGEVPADDYTKWVDGYENRNLRVGDCHRPLLQLEDAAASPDGRITATVRFARAEGGPPLDAATVLVHLGDDPVAATIDAEQGLITVDVTGLAAGKHSLRVRATDEAGTAAENEPLWTPLWVEDEPWSWKDGTMYFVFLDRFRNGDGSDGAPPIDNVSPAANYWGGDLLGLLHAIEDGWFEDLGVDVLWLSPLLDNPQGAYAAADGQHQFSGFHGYWPIDPFAIEDHLGDVEATAAQRLDEVIAAAHSRGIRIVFDLVLNHVHEDHLYVAEHPEWFGGGCICGAPGCGWDERARDCWFMPYLPDLDYRNHDVLRRVTDDTIALLQRFDVDGVRVDAAKHMDHVIMRTLRMRLRDEVERGGGSPFHLVGETFTGADGHGLILDYMADHELSGQFDFPLLWPVRDAFAHGGSFAALDAAVLDGQDQWGDFVMSPFFGNHDVLRFTTDAAGNGQGAWASTPDLLAEGGDTVTQQGLIDRVTLAAAFTLTQPGLPLLYYGDEIGLAGDGDPDNRRPMTFPPYLSANQELLLDRVRAIGQSRAASPALRGGIYRSLWSDADLLVYARDAGDGDVAVVALHKGQSARSLDVPLQGILGNGIELLDSTHLGRTATTASGALPLSLGPWDWAIFVRPPGP